MTTKDSPLAKLKAQADVMAQRLKKAEPISRGQTGPTVKFAVFMDDKIISITMTWDLIRDTAEEALSEYIVQQMREEQPQ